MAPPLGPGIRLDSSNAVPLYRQIHTILANRIADGTLAPGETVPGEAAICDEFGVSRITARRALNDLAAEGLVVREQGRGTRVAAQRRAPVLSATLEGLFENVGHIGRTTTVEVLDFRYLPASAAVAAALEIAPGARVQRAVRVRKLAGRAMSYLVTTVPEAVGRLVEGQDLSETPLLLLLERAGVPVASATQTISATLADPEIALALDVSAGSPLIEVNRLIRDDRDRPVEMIRVLYRPDLYRFEMRMQRVPGQNGSSWRAETPETVATFEM